VTNKPVEIMRFFIIVPHCVVTIHFYYNGRFLNKNYIADKAAG